MLTKKIVSILALSSVLLATAPAQAGGGFDGGSNMSIRMHAYVRQSSHADFRTTQLALDLGEEPSAFRTIGMRIEPLV